MPAEKMPEAEVDITVDLVRELLREQHADLAELDLRLFANGFDNTLYRLGDDYLVRLPRRRLGAELVMHEERWLPVLAPKLPLPVPAPLRVGRPTDRYPWNWTIVPWFEGTSASPSALADPARTALRLGEFLAALHRPAPPDAPANPLRGVPLAARHRRFAEHVDAVADEIDADVVRFRWQKALSAPLWDGAPLWIHGDLHPLNLVHRDGELIAVVDFGDITAGDPATDLLIAWYLFDEPHRAIFRAAADSAPRPIDDDMWERGRGWAIAHSVATLANSADVPGLNAMGRRALHAALD